MNGVGVPTRDDIAAAASRIEPHVRRTPVLHLAAGVFGVDGPLTLKLELLQVTGSFKIDKVRGTGADVRVIEGYYDDAAAAGQERRAGGTIWMHPFDQPEVVAGQGTIGAEIADQVPDADTVLVAVGGGGLIGGVASWFAGTRTRVIGVEPATCCSLHTAMAQGGPVEVPVSGRAADSLGARRVGDIAFAAAGEGHVDGVVLVDDAAILEAQRALWRELRLFAEPGGAAALAAVGVGAFEPAPGERVVVLVCGSNGDPSDVIG
jgi:threonine dehydratase